MNFIGIWEKNIIENRVVLPVKLFNKIKDDNVIITIGINNSIAIFPLDSWGKIYTNLKNGNNKQKNYLNFLMDYADEQKIEKSGRVKLSEDLLNASNIKEKVIIKGNGNFISVWSLEKFLESRKKQLEKFKDIDFSDLLESENENEN